MQIHEQIRYERNQLNLSQEALADAIYVSRQSISNWETGKNYPDLESLIALSELFQISLDKLVKGDLEIMRNRIEENDINELKRMSIILAIGFVGIIILIAPMYIQFGWQGAVVWFILVLFVLAYSLKVERFKKKHQLETYRDITEFMDGISTPRTQAVLTAKQKLARNILLALGSGILSFSVMYVLMEILS